MGDKIERPDPENLYSRPIHSQRVESQIVVDFQRALEQNPDWKPSAPQAYDFLAQADDVELIDNTIVEDDRVWDSKLYLDLENQVEWTLAQGHVEPSGDDLLLLPDRVFAYILRDREWACLSCRTDSFSEVEANQEAWHALKIDDEHKKIVQSLIHAHFGKQKSTSQTFDLIRDKGKGVILLLHGVPGVGKASREFLQSFDFQADLTVDLDRRVCRRVLQQASTPYHLW